MSKKLAENLDRLVLDVKFGRGAFMKTREEAERLASSMTEVGELMDVQMSHLLSPMDEPLGRAVGNALEVAECVEILQGGGPADLIALILDLGTKVSDASREQLSGWLRDGSAWNKFVQLVEAQGGDATSLQNMAEVHRAPLVQTITAKHDGAITRVDAEVIGRASVLLGGGRQKADDTVNFAVGFSQLKKVGEAVRIDEPLCIVHARSDAGLSAVLPLVESAFELS
jgi:pyrimidine-nucleoside phosphorylase